MSLSATEIEAVVAELAPLEGGRLQKIWVPEPRVAILELRAPGASRQLLLSALPDETRLHLTTSRPPSPKTPLAFQGLLRAHLDPARLASIRALRGDRIVRLDFETPAGPRALVAELTGRHGNLLLLGPEDRILGLAVASRPHSRPLRQGDVHTLPPAQPPRSEPPRFEAPEGGDFPLSRAIEAHYVPRAREREGRDDRREAARLLAQAKKRAERALQKVEGEAARAKDAEALRRFGELLKPLQGKIGRGESWVEATDYRESGVVQVKIPLRPELSPKQNLERYFKEYRRMSAARERIGARRAELEAVRDRAIALQARLEEARSPEEIEGLLAEARSLRGRRQSQKGSRDKSPRLPYRAFVSASGKAIWVGRGSRDNDALSFRVAKGSDLWLHARGLPGAHVVVPLGRGQVADTETFLDACALAAHFSQAKDEAAAEVASTQVKNLRKPKGAAPGAAIVTQEKTTLFRCDLDRIERLLRSEQI